VQEVGGVWDVIAMKKFCSAGVGQSIKSAYKWLPIFRPTMLSFVSVVHKQGKQSRYDVILMRFLSLIILAVIKQ